MTLSGATQPNAARAIDARKIGQSLWYDNISKSLLQCGELKQLIDSGVITGITTNPTIFQKAVDSTDAYDQHIRNLAGAGKDITAIYNALTIDDVREAAGLLRGVYHDTNGVDGYVSLELPPELADDPEGSVEEAKRLAAALDCDNIMIKVPGTPAGVRAFQQLTDAGINVNVTLLFSLDQYIAVAEAYVAALRSRANRGDDMSGLASVASFFVSRVDSAVDKELEAKNAEDLKGKAGIANCKIVYQKFQEIFGDSFADLRAKGARAQRVLWASTSTKNPKFSDVLYVDTLLGPDTVNTLPPNTLTAFLDHGVAERSTILDDVDGAKAHLAALAKVGVDLGQVCDELLQSGVASFADSFNALLKSLENKAGL